MIDYDSGHYLLISVTMLPLAHIVEASPERPYLCVRLNLDPHEVGALVLDPASQTASSAPSTGSPRGLRAARVSPDLLDALTRLLRLLSTPEHVAALAPLARREILYRVLTGELGGLLHAMGMGDGSARRIAQAIEWIKQAMRSPCASTSSRRRCT